MDKKCGGCNEIKLDKDFSKDKNSKDGLCFYCRACRKTINTSRKNYYREYYRDNREKFKENYQNYIKFPENKIKQTESSIKWAKANPEKVRASRQLRYAIKYNKIKKKPCEVCGDQNTQGHHEDYSKPLDVVWLCRLHHRLLHNNKINSI